jgi:hypothetical protein
MVRLRARSAIPNILLACGLMWTAAACSKDSPTSPSANSRTVTGLNVRGCAEAEGYQCRAFLAYSNGEQNEVSAQTAWESNNWPVARADATGRVTPKFAGTVTLRGIYKGGDPGHGTEGTQQITVMVPPVELRGTVRDYLSGRPVAGAEVKVVTGPNAGTVTTTNAQGGWVLAVTPTEILTFWANHPDYYPANFHQNLGVGDILAERKFELRSRSTPPPAPTPPPPSPPPPLPDQILQEFDGKLDSYQLPYCAAWDGRSWPCRTFTLAASPHRKLNAELTWHGEWSSSDGDTELEFEIYQGRYTLAARSYKVSAGIARIDISTISANTPLEIRVMIVGGTGPVLFNLKTSRSTP